MALKLMYITNRPDVAKMAEDAGTDRIFVDMEYIGKKERQGGMDTVQSRHTLEDVAAIRTAISRSKLLVRCNPIHEKTDEYCGSQEEIDSIVENGADIIMLPYFKTVEEVKGFLSYVDGRVRICLLVETPEAVAAIDEILDLPGIDEVLIGLNDLSLGYGKKFMFELLADGTVEALCEKFADRGIPYGFGGIASLGRGMLPAEYIIREHYRLGSTCSILSRSFCNANIIQEPEIIRAVFNNGIREIRSLEASCRRHLEEGDKAYFDKNRKTLCDIVNTIMCKRD